MEFSVGQPEAEGRYVIFTPCEALAAREYCEPHIATWHGGKWHTWRQVWGWIGPLPVVHGNECLTKIQATPTYDL